MVRTTGRSARAKRIKLLPTRSAAEKRKIRLTYENIKRVDRFHTKSIKESRKHLKLAKKFAKKGQIYIPREGSLTAFRGKKIKPKEVISRVFSERRETKLAQHAVAHVPFTTQQNIYGESTAIYSMAYDPDKKVLRLTFWKYKQRGAGGTYLYYNVPLELWKSLQQASSKGRFFWYNIRGLYNFRRVK